MKISIFTKVTIGVVVVIVTLCVSMAISLDARSKQTESRKLVLHTYQVLNLLERVHSMMKDAETGHRGFLLTGQNEYLEPHKRATSKIDDLIEELKVQLSDNPAQQHRLGILTVKTDEVLDSQQASIEVRRQRGLQAAAGASHFELDKERMEEIHSTIEEMIKTEETLLNERSDKLNAATATAFTYSTLFSVASIVCVGVAGLALLGFLRAQQKSERELQVQYSVARILNESNDLQDAARRIEQLIGETGAWCIGATWLVQTNEQRENVLTCLDLWRLAPFADSQFTTDSRQRTFKKGEGLPGRVWESARATSISNVTQDSNFPRSKVAEQIGLKTAFAFPITFGGDVLAVTEFFATDERPVDQALLDMMTAIGNQLGQFIVRKTVEVETEKQRQFLQLILDTVSDGIMVADTEGRFILTNVAAKELTGQTKRFTRDDWSDETGVYLNEAGDKYPLEQLPLLRAIRGEEVDDAEMLIRNDSIPTGKWLSVSARPLREIEDEVTGAVIFFRNVSEKKEAEKRVSEFYSTVSHELRTPLTSIRGSLGLIEGGLAGPLPDKTLKLIKIARAESDRLIRLINDILDLRKIEAGMLELKKRTCDTQKLVERAIEGIQGMANERGVTVSEEINTGGPTECDEDRIIQVLTNLLSNAIKFSENGDRVVVALNPGEHNTFKFSISDTGPGIAPEQMHKLFGKFQQLDQSDSRKKDGTGLGLAITKAIIDEHGGAIGVDSEWGKGSTFWFELPATFSPVRNVAVGNLPAAHVHPALIVEDDKNVSEVLRTHLEADGFEVIHASSLKEASDFLDVYTPLVILLDLGLPDGNGLDLMERLQSDEKRKNIPVVIISGTEKDGKTTCVHPALIDWMVKPFNEKRLHAALDNARRRIGIAQVLVVEDDPSTREILKQQVESLGVKCIEATSGEDALKSFDESNPDLVILDLMIPPPDGFEVVEKLRGRLDSSVPLVVYSALDLTEAEKAKLTLGITAHLTKSTASPDQLSNVIREFLNGLMLRKESDESLKS
ncbi:response regulator [Candidatus Obscuribacterales bacterium]|nr:response regulator [Candidatus Obscuribacterales bacterium]